MQQCSVERAVHAASCHSQWMVHITVEHLFAVEGHCAAYLVVLATVTVSRRVSMTAVTLQNFAVSF